LDVEALLETDVSAVLALVQEQTGTSDHQAFVKRLSEREE
jgi:hypothetical protein